MLQPFFKANLTNKSPSQKYVFLSSQVITHLNLMSHLHFLFYIFFISVSYLPQDFELNKS